MLRNFVLASSLAASACLFAACSSSSVSQSPATSTPPNTTASAPLDYISTDQVPAHNGQIETVRFRVARTYTTSAGTEFLDEKQDYTNGFVVTIFSSDTGRFEADPASTPIGSEVDVTGRIQKYDGYWEILNPSSIHVLN